jgi:hypothetical protein
MLLHIRPRLFSPFHVQLVDMEIKTINLRLTGGADLATRRPYRNKNYAVACRREARSRKAIDGILIETSSPVREMEYTARWSIQGAASLAIHEVHYTLLDSDYDAASDNMVLWYGCGPEFGNRWPMWAKNLAPIDAEPKMEVVPAETADGGNKLESYAEDVRDEHFGWIVHRRQTFAMPTLERERVLSTTLEPRQPLLGSAFWAQSAAR